jgi:hypothetical protein
MQTTLNLLTRSGTVFMEFRPHLTPEQYARLLEISEATNTADELREALKQWAKAEGLDARFEE